MRATFEGVRKQSSRPDYHLLDKAIKKAARQKDGKGHFTMLRAFRGVVGAYRAFLLFDLANYGKSNADESGWILCTAGWLKNGGYPASVEQDLSWLEENGWLKTRRDATGQRHVKLRTHKVAQAL